MTLGYIAQEIHRLSVQRRIIKIDKYNVFKTDLIQIERLSMDKIN